MNTEREKWMQRLGLTEEDLNPSPEQIEKRERKRKKEERRELIAEVTARSFVVFNYINILLFAITQNLWYAVIGLLFMIGEIPFFIYFFKRYYDA